MAQPIKTSIVDPKILKKVNTKVYSRFPEVAGVKPKIRKQLYSKGKNNKSAPMPPTYLFIFHGKGKGPNGKVIPRWIRVVVDNNGKILKTTTSR